MWSQYYLNNTMLRWSATILTQMVIDINNNYINAKEDKSLQKNEKKKKKKKNCYNIRY